MRVSLKLAEVPGCTEFKQQEAPSQLVLSLVLGHHSLKARLGNLFYFKHSFVTFVEILFTSRE